MLKKFFLATSSGILCSRVAGFARDLLSASVLGSGLYSDIFFVAFKFPNLFRRIFAEGAFSQSFLPAFISSRYKGAFLFGIFGVFSLFLCALVLVVAHFRLFFTKLLAYGFSPHAIDLAKDIVAINFYYLLLIFWATFFSALLQSKNHFWVSGYHTILLNLAMIAALVWHQDENLLEVVRALSYGVLCGGCAQVCLHFYPLYKLGFLRLFAIGAHSLLKAKPCQKAVMQQERKRFFKQFFPSVLGNSTAQISAFIDTLLASFLATGSISYLYYANRIFQLPLALFAIATSTALFPTIARAIKNNDTQKATAHLQQAFDFLSTMLLVCTLGGVVLSKDIIALLFGRGQFGAQDVAQCSKVFCAYLVGLTPFGVAKIFALWLYAHKEQGKAAKIALISLIFGTLCSLALMPYLHASGLALSSSLSGFLLCGLYLRAFGFKRFLGMISLSKCVFLGLLLALEAVVLALFVGVLQTLKAWIFLHHLF
ncbi:Integral membrane protein MviN [Helicobacter sp. NHP21005]|uniref:murein biosynthesis integral membrane protein MurJ n=1 Tax=Helicobacter felistomachi TaxID=3040201 RepID=UPI0025738EE3|nr:murein biosynthesis integral membrane protein MurJ [Helicobacter sp. NHP21005]BEG56771.1 Integral membrane protein MviN [Helicobacter sp. NHP21005]